MGSAAHEQHRNALEARHAALTKRLGALDEATSDPVRHALKAVEDALSRLDNGTYGTCEMCKGRIDDARLAADPITPFCADCEQRQASVITSDPHVE
jgi:RNA polymerase-binding transcription factor DksA